jgi:hypothetical protein
MDKETLDNPELNDFTEATPDVEQQPETAEATPAPDLAKPEWDAERQRADQAEANFRKLQREKAEIESKAQQTEAKIAEYEAKLAEVAKANDINLDGMEDEFVDPAAYRVVKSLQQKLSSLETLANDYKKQEQERQAKEKERQLEQSREQAKNEILTDIESEYGVQYRNDALKMADSICEKRGYPPQDRYEAATILRKCYRDLSTKKATPSSKTPVSTDSGKTTTAASPKEDVKPGTLREVMQQMRAKAGLG